MVILGEITGNPDQPRLIFHFYYGKKWLLATSGETLMLMAKPQLPLKKKKKIGAFHLERRELKPKA
jgi:hypothetical protein